MNILTICHELPPVSGGGGIGALGIARELAKSNTVHVIAPRYKGMQKTEISGGLVIHRVRVIGSVNVEANSALNMPLAFASFIVSAITRGLLLHLKHRFDAIHTHFVIPAGLAGYMLSAVTRVPHLTTIVEAEIFDPRRQGVEPFKNPLILGLVGRIINSCSAAVAISSFMKTAAERYCAVSKPVVVINHGREKIDIAPVDRSSMGLRDSDFLIAAVSRLVKRKGYNYLLDTIARTDGNVKLLIMGAGPERAALEARARALGIEDKVVFLGRVTDEQKYRYLSVSDIFALHSLHEGMGIVYLEAMYFGLPVVTTNDGGQGDLMVEGVNGFMLSVGDVEGALGKINLLRGDRALREKMSRDNRARALDFGIEKTAQKYSILFEKISGRPK